MLTFGITRKLISKYTLVTLKLMVTAVSLNCMGDDLIAFSRGK